VHSRSPRGEQAQQPSALKNGQRATILTEVRTASWAGELGFGQQQARLAWIVPRSPMAPGGLMAIACTNGDPWCVMAGHR
jgi:hypothetical protein